MRKRVKMLSRVLAVCITGVMVLTLSPPALADITVDTCSNVTCSDPTPSPRGDTPADGYRAKGDDGGEEKRAKKPPKSSLPKDWTQQTVNCGEDSDEAAATGGCIFSGCDEEGVDPHVTLTRDAQGMLRRQSDDWCPTEENSLPATVRSEYASLSVPVAVPSIEPSTETYVGVTNYFTADAQPVTQTVRVLDQDVLIRSTPYAWHYKWGEKIEDIPGRYQKEAEEQPTQFATAGNPIPTNDADERGKWYRKHLNREDIDHSQYVTHLYYTTGTITLTMTVYFTGEYSTDNGATWHSVPGSVQSSAPGLALELCELRATLVDPDHPVQDPGTCKHTHN